MIKKDKLKKCREEMGFSRSKLAKHIVKFGIDVTEATILNWENKKSVPDCNQYYALCKFYKKPLSYFYK